MNFVQTYAATMACMMIGMNSVTVVWFCLQPDWKPERFWEKPGWFEPFGGDLKFAITASTHVLATPTGSRAREPWRALSRRDSDDLATAIERVRTSG